MKKNKIKKMKPGWRAPEQRQMLPGLDRYRPGWLRFAGMEIHIARDGQRSGPFSADEVRRQLAAGVLLPTDLGWTEGASGWAPLSTLPDLRIAAAGLPPPPPPGPPGLAVTGHPAVRTVVVYQAGRTSGAAVASLVCGILSISFLPIFASIPAIICGHIARRDIRNSGGSVAGDGMAVAGLVMGYVHGVLLAGVLLFFAVVALVVIVAAVLSPGK